MWTWRFTVRPLSGDGAPFVAVLDDSADAFTAFTVWNESGYGSTPDQQHTSWWSAQYRRSDDAELAVPTSWTRD